MRFVPVKSSGVACSNSGIWRKTGQTGRMYTDYGSGDTGTGTSVVTRLYLVLPLTYSEAVVNLG